MSETTPARRSIWAGFLGAVRTPLGATAGALLTVVFLLAVVGPMIWGAQAREIDPSSLFEHPSSEHLLGTDALGRDLFARLLTATRLSVLLALLATLLGVSVGVLLGTAPWLLGRRIGRFATATVNTAIAFPSLLLALFFAVVFGAGASGAVPAIGFAMAPWFARITQALVAGIQERDFIAAARIAGAGKIRILFRHILPNIGEPLIVNAMVAAGGSLLAFSGLSFLGLGVQAPEFDWGVLLNEGLDGIYVNPAGAVAPGILIVVAGLAFNLFGEAAAKSLGRRTALTLTRAPARPASPGRIAGVDAVDAPDGGPGRVLTIDGLTISVPSAAGSVAAVRDIEFSIGPGEIVGVVGESGSGKSLTALAVGQLLEPPVAVVARAIEFAGLDFARPVAPLTARRVLGRSLGLVFQDPMSSFNPTMRVGRQLSEVAEEHDGIGRKAGLARAVERLKSVRVPAAARRAGQFPHEFSGGMRQRAMIAMAIMGEPSLIVADEPTTALDVTVQRQVLQLLLNIRDTRGTAIVLISHDVTVVGEVCDRVLVMYAGRIVEDLPVGSLYEGARHPYTRALVAAVPDMTSDRSLPLAVIPGRPVDPAHRPPGCAFAPRCPRATEVCRTDDPPLTVYEPGHRLACWHPVESEDAAAPAQTPAAQSEVADV